MLKPDIAVDPPILIGDDGFMKTNQEFVDYLNSYFSGIGQVLSNDMSTKGVPERVIFTEPRDPKHCKIVVNKYFVEILIGEINVNKTSGIEGIRCDILKMAMKLLLDQMTWLFQLTFDQGIFPSAWKQARVNPIPKNGNLKLITNWRPISLLPVPSKIAENLMHMHLSEVVEKNFRIQIAIY